MDIKGMCYVLNVRKKLQSHKQGGSTLNRFLCFITGGHRYKDIDGKAFENGKEMIFTHTCCKCGKKTKVSIPLTKLFSEWELQLLGYSKEDEDAR